MAMFGYTYQSDILSSSKFWEPEEIFWSVGLVSALFIVMLLVLVYCIARGFFEAMGYGSRGLMRMACPVFYSYCCMTDVERLREELEDSNAMGAHRKKHNNNNKKANNNSNTSSAMILIPDERDLV
jgi:hypothetical protein